MVDFGEVLSIQAAHDGCSSQQCAYPTIDAKRYCIVLAPIPSKRSINVDLLVWSKCPCGLGSVLPKAKTKVMEVGDAGSLLMYVLQGCNILARSD